MDGPLVTAELELLRKDFASNPAYRLAQNAVTRVSVDDVAINREIITASTTRCPRTWTTGRSPTRSAAAGAGCSPG